MRHARSRSSSLQVTFDPLPAVDESSAPLDHKPDADPLAHHFPPEDSPTPPPSSRGSRSSLADLDSVRRIGSTGSLEANLHRSPSWLHRLGARTRDLAEAETGWAVPRTLDDEDDESEDEEPLVVRPRQRRQISDEASSASASSIASPTSPRSAQISPASSRGKPMPEDDDEDVAEIMATHCKPSPLSRLLSLALPDLDDHHDLTPRGDDPTRPSSWLRLHKS